MLKKGLWFPLLVLLLLLSGCPNTQCKGDAKCADFSIGNYTLQVDVNGETDSFKTFRIEINGVPLKERETCMAKDSHGCSAWGVEHVVEFCTEDEETFLQKPLDIVVYQGNLEIHRFHHERASCPNSTEEVKSERCYFLLTTEGKIEEDPAFKDNGPYCGFGPTFVCADAQDRTSPL
ncbi:MAG: hypothetical protein FWD46_01575 [Cystobacterineae bacterium]|nr:hypothetical protein [Cystobacterineae bacterium]